MKKNLFLIILIASIITSCSKETELTDSIYVADQEDPNLPAYTEWGYNTFGVIWERKYFTYSTSEIPLKITKNNDSISFLFQGINSTNYEYMGLRFTYIDGHINDYLDFLSYQDHSVNFIYDTVKVELLQQNMEPKTLNILDGTLHFKRAQTLFIDDREEEQIILSGTFSLKFLDNAIPESMTGGRFDFGINDDIFYDLSGY